MLYHLTIYFLGDQVLTLTACLLGCAFMNDIRFRISVFMVDRLGIVAAPYWNVTIMVVVPVSRLWVVVMLLLFWNVGLGEWNVLCVWFALLAA